MTLLSQNLTMICPECDSQMILRTGAYGKFYGCSRWPRCSCKHGAHDDGTPLGKPANKETRQWRIKAHDAFDQLWKSGKMKRKEAYVWMRKVMKLPHVECHIAMFDIEQCKQLINHVSLLNP